MGRRKRKDRTSKTPADATRLRRGKWLSFGLPGLLVAMLALSICFVFFSKTTPATPEKNASTKAMDQPKTARKAGSMKVLLAMTPEQLAEVDIAEMNLLCATGLPGAESLDIDKRLARLGEWAAKVREVTEQNMWAFRQNPAKYRNSENKFRVLLLVSVLQLEYGVHYNYRGERNCDFSNSKNPFIHGMIDDTNGGTCASMPVLYVAVGRRLGYPMKLVLAKTHVFARWLDPNARETFNIEGTNDVFSDHPDSYYRNWPYPITDEEVREGWYMKPLTPAEELAVFLQDRAYCLQDNGRREEARTAFVYSYRLAPQNPFGPAQIADASDAGRPVRTARVQRGLGTGIVDEFGAPMVYREQMYEAERINASNRVNMERITNGPGTPSLTPGIAHAPVGYVPRSPYGARTPFGPQPQRQPGRP